MDSERDMSAFYAYLSGMCLGIALGVASIKILNGDNEKLTSQINQMKTECEAKLPRDQECHMIFVPNQK